MIVILRNLYFLNNKIIKVCPIKIWIKNAKKLIKRMSELPIIKEIQFETIGRYLFITIKRLVIRIV